MRTFEVLIETRCLVTVADGAQIDEDSVILAADTENRHNEAKAESIEARVLGRKRSIVK